MIDARVSGEMPSRPRNIQQSTDVVVMLSFETLSNYRHFSFFPEEAGFTCLTAFLFMNGSITFKVFMISDDFSLLLPLVSDTDHYVGHPRGPASLSTFAPTPPLAGVYRYLGSSDLAMPSHCGGPEVLLFWLM